MDAICLEHLALLELLVEIDQGSRVFRVQALRERLVEEGLAETSDGQLTLTDAGIERCKSLHHRVRADREAADVLKERDCNGEGPDSPE